MKNKILSFLLASIFITSVSGCDLNPLSWVNKAKDSVNNKINAPATEEDKAVIPVAPGLPTPDKPVSASCSSDPALVLCVTYPSIEALLADPNTKKFGFSIVVGDVEVHKGSLPALKYRLQKDGSITRG